MQLDAPVVVLLQHRRVGLPHPLLLLVVLALKLAQLLLLGVHVVALLLRLVERRLHLALLLARLLLALVLLAREAADERVLLEHAQDVVGEWHVDEAVQPGPPLADGALELRALFRDDFLVALQPLLLVALALDPHELLGQRLQLVLDRALAVLRAREVVAQRRAPEVFVGRAELPFEVLHLLTHARERRLLPRLRARLQPLLELACLGLQRARLALLCAGLLGRVLELDAQLLHLGALGLRQALPLLLRVAQLGLPVGQHARERLGHLLHVRDRRLGGLPPGAVALAQVPLLHLGGRRLRLLLDFLVVRLLRPLLLEHARRAVARALGLLDLGFHRRRLALDAVHIGHHLDARRLLRRLDLAQLLVRLLERAAEGPLEALVALLRRLHRVVVLVSRPLVRGARGLTLLLLGAQRREAVAALLDGVLGLVYLLDQRVFVHLRLLQLRAQPVGLRELRLERLELGGEHLDVLRLVEAVGLDRIERFCVVGRGEDVVEPLLEHLVLGERPARVLLVHEDDRVEHRGRDVHHLGHELVEVGALVAEARLVAVLVDRLQRRLEGLVLLALRLLHE